MAKRAPKPSGKMQPIRNQSIVRAYDTDMHCRRCGVITGHLLHGKRICLSCQAKPQETAA